MELSPIVTKVGAALPQPSCACLTLVCLEAVLSATVMGYSSATLAGAGKRLRTKTMADRCYSVGLGSGSEVVAGFTIDEVRQWRSIIGALGSFLYLRQPGPQTPSSCTGTRPNTIQDFWVASCFPIDEKRTEVALDPGKAAAER